MSGPDSGDGDRRRNPRFSCAGRATIRCLPFDGKSVSGILRDLSAGGICLDINGHVEPGVQAELVVYANAASFRAAAQVTGKRSRGTSLQFVQISTRGKDVLADLLRQLARVQALNRKLRSSRIDDDTERMLTDQDGFSFLIIGEQGGEQQPPESLRRDAPTGAKSKEAAKREKKDFGLIQVDLFG